MQVFGSEAACPRHPELVVLSVVLKLRAKGTSGKEVYQDKEWLQELFLSLYLVNSQPHRKYRALVSKPG